MRKSYNGLARKHGFTVLHGPRAPAHEGGKNNLAFDGLDTYCTVLLNGSPILQGDNMFLPYRVDVTEKIKSTNTLKIVFPSTFAIGKKIMNESKHKFGIWGGEPSRLGVRKAPYHYGWDWGPIFLTCGPWKPIRLEMYQARIQDLYFRINFTKLNSKEVEVELFCDYEGDASEVVFDLSFEGNQVAKTAIPARSGNCSAKVTLRNPHLWYPSGYGDQPLYTLAATLFEGEGKTMDSVTKKVGIREAKLIQRPLVDEPGTTFFFEVNGIPIFCGGSNWIPGDSFLPRITSQKYRDWVQLLVEGNQVMARVWGGGIYEEDSFYDACDELGILLWQDFLFACASYPADPAFLDRVRDDSVANVKRLRHHTCIVIFAGNNEDYQYQESANLTYDRNDKDPQSWLRSDFPARYIYEKLLKDICDELVPDTPYHFGSPYGGAQSSDPTIGDKHEWNVWHAAQRPYQDYKDLGGRFVSEFGMQACPDLKTIEAVISEPAELRPDSATMDWHNKFEGHDRRIALYLAENFRSYSTLYEYVCITQLMQAEAIGTAYREWRRKWRGPGRESTAGALVWQLNDCWPVVSWSLVDYFLRPKLAYYAVKRELRPLTVGVERRLITSPNDDLADSFPHKHTQILVWASNFTLQEVTGKLLIQSFALNGKLVSEQRQDVTLKASQSSELYEDKLPAGEELNVIHAKFVSGRETCARFSNWPQPLKHLNIRKANLKKTIEENVIVVSTDVPVKGLRFESTDSDDELKLSDNGMDLMPGDNVRIQFRGAKAKKLKALALDQYV